MFLRQLSLSIVAAKLGNKWIQHSRSVMTRSHVPFCSDRYIRLPLSLTLHAKDSRFARSMHFHNFTDTVSAPDRVIVLGRIPRCESLREYNRQLRRVRMYIWTLSPILPNILLEMILPRIPVS